jgi:hypothetical protein
MVSAVVKQTKTYLKLLEIMSFLDIYVKIRKYLKNMVMNVMMLVQDVDMVCTVGGVLMNMIMILFKLLIIQ